MGAQIQKIKSKPDRQRRVGEIDTRSPSGKKEHKN